jgi:hypothetical protein
MGVKHLWRTLEKGGAVELLDGGDAAQHCEILDELEGAAVAVDLSAWLVQAQTQPALAQNYDSDFACALKVVFDRVRRPAKTTLSVARSAASRGLRPAYQPLSRP